MRSAIRWEPWSDSRGQCGLGHLDNWHDAVDRRKAYFRDVRPADTIMAVSRFVNPEWLIEVEADDVVADQARPLDLDKCFGS